MFSCCHPTGLQKKIAMILTAVNPQTLDEVTACLSLYVGSILGGGGGGGGGDVWKRDCAAFIEDSEGIVKPTVSGTGLG